MSRLSPCFAALLAFRFLSAQSAGLSLPRAVQAAVQSYPSTRAAAEQVNAASAAIDLARTAYLPRVDTLAQVNRATRNNVFGMLLPQSTIPSISGPVLGTNNTGTVWGSALGGLVSWEPFDFGLRHANVAAAEAARAESAALRRRTEFEVAVTAADAYLTLVAAQDTVRAAQAAVDRAEVFLRSVTALVDAQLRPGADASRAEAELAAARTQYIRGQQAVAVARASLAQYLGGDPAALVTDAPRLAELPPEEPLPPLDTAHNPIAAQQTAVIEQTQAQLRALSRSYFPRFYAQAAAYARGTGAETNGVRLGGANGLAPTTQNFAVGFSVTFPVFDFAAAHAREAAQAARMRAETARYQQIAADLRAQWNRAVATLQGNRSVAANTPVQLSAARATLRQATARYEAGLAAIDQIADAQRLVTQAEIDDALARLGVWRGLLGVAAAAGDLQPFLIEAGQ